MHANRRAFLAGAAAAPLALSLVPARAGAAAPGAQVLGIQHVRAGDGVVTAMLDGHLALGAEMFQGLAAGEAEALLAAAFRAPGPVPTGVNCYLYRDAARTVLIDAGGANAFPGLGGLFAALEAAECAPEEVDTVLVTHLHPDHIGGLIRDGAATFPNAALHVGVADITFWTSAEMKAAAPADFAPFFDLAAAVLAAYGERVQPITGEGEVIAGIEGMALPGHTLGHTGYLIHGAEPLLVWGDVVHVGAFQFAKPAVTIGFDTDPALAATTRAVVFDMAATDRLRVAGMHLAFPGIGHLERAGEGYRFAPADWTFSLG